MELEAYESGVVEKVLVDEGQTVPIGQPIMLIGDGSGAARRRSATRPREALAGPDPPATSPATRERGSSPEPTAERRSRSRRAQPSPAQLRLRPPGARDGTGPRRWYCAPPRPAAQPQPGCTRSQRRTARSRPRRWRGRSPASSGVEPGVGPGQRPRRSGDPRRRGAGGDRAARPAAPAPVPPAGEGEQRARASRPRCPSGPGAGLRLVPTRRSRRSRSATSAGSPARRMVESLQSAPHFFLTALIDVTDLLALRAQVNGQLGEGDAQDLGERPDRQGVRADAAGRPRGERLVRWRQDPAEEADSRRDRGADRARPDRAASSRTPIRRASGRSRGSRTP